MPMILSAGGDTAQVSEQPAVSLSVTDSTRVVTTAFGVAISVATVNLPGSGTWTLTKLTGPAGRPDVLRLRPGTTTGTSTTVEVGVPSLATADIGTWTWRVSYLGDGLGSPVSAVLTLSVVTEYVITASPATPTVTVGDAVGTAITTVTTSTAGAGTWSLQSGSWSKARMRGTSGKSQVVELGSSPVAADVGAKSVSVRYAGDGIATALTKSVPITVATASTGTRTWKSGWWQNSQVGQYAAIKALVGHDPQVVVMFPGMADVSWATAAGYFSTTSNSDYKRVLQYCYDVGALPVISVAVSTEVRGISTPVGVLNHGNFAQINNGSQDTAITALGANIRAIMGSTRPCVFRIGWESTNYQKWKQSRWTIAEDDNLGWRTAWQRVATRLRAAYGTNALTGLNQLKNWYSIGGYAAIGLDRDAAYGKIWPGDSYVDLVTSDYYDASPPATATNYDTWKSTSIQHLMDWATAKNKKLAVDEWGLWRKLVYSRSATTTTTAWPDGVSRPYYLAGGGDNPDYIRHMYRFLSENKSRVEYDCFFRIAGFTSYTAANFQSGSGLTTETAIHGIYQVSSDGATRIRKTVFRGATDFKGTTNLGDCVGHDSSLATNDSGPVYESLFWPESGSG